MKESFLTATMIANIIPPRNTAIIIDFQNLVGIQKKHGMINLIQMIKTFQEVGVPKESILIFYPDHFTESLEEVEGEKKHSRISFLQHLEAVSTVIKTGTTLKYGIVETNNDPDIIREATKLIWGLRNSPFRITNLILFSGDIDLAGLCTGLGTENNYIACPHDCRNDGYFNLPNTFCLNWDTFVSEFKKGYTSNVEKPKPKRLISA